MAGTSATYRSIGRRVALPQSQTWKWSKLPPHTILGEKVSGVIVRNAQIRWSSSHRPQVMRTVQDMRAFIKSKRLSQKDLTFGFVPTMGALHDGHLSLIKAAAKENKEVVVSIYVNPTQFGANEDLASYPRTFDTDMAMIEELNTRELASQKMQGRVTAVFTPTTKEMYPTLPPSSEEDGNGSFVLIKPIGGLLEGAQRPVFFRGVATVCMKLFNIVAADRVYFGQKDAQQAVVIRRMVKDFHLDTQVCVQPTSREPDRLAMSSRNVYLGARRRRAATVLPEMLHAAAERYEKEGKLSRAEILEPFRDLLDGQVHSRQIEAYGEAQFQLGYVSIADPDTMEEIEVVDEDKGAILCAALLMLPVEDVQPNEDAGEADGTQRTVRLIDNIVLKARSN